jgi:hypothetical protein
MLAAALLFSVSAFPQKIAPPPAMPTAPLPDSIWYHPPVTGLNRPAARIVEQEARRAAADGAAFEAIFEQACLHRPVGSSPADLFRGLIRWASSGGSAKFQGRTDWPFHFIYGGYFSASDGLAAGENAAYLKEQRDAFTPGNFFDLDDYAVTLLGARWASKGGSCGQLRSIPALRFGGLPHGRMPSMETLGKIRAFVDSAL